MDLIRDFIYQNIKFKYTITIFQIIIERYILNKIMDSIVNV